MSIHYKEEGIDLPALFPEESKTNDHIIDLDISSRKLRTLIRPNIQISSKKKSFFANYDPQDLQRNLISSKSKPAPPQSQSSSIQSSSKSKAIANLFRPNNDPFRRRLQPKDFLQQTFSRIISSQQCEDNKPTPDVSVFTKKIDNQTQLIFQGQTVEIEPLTCLLMQKVTLSIYKPVCPSNEAVDLTIKVTMTGTQNAIWTAHILQAKSEIFQHERADSAIISILKQDQDAFINDTMYVRFVSQEKCDQFQELMKRFLKSSREPSARKSSNRVPSFTENVQILPPVLVSQTQQACNQSDKSTEQIENKEDLKKEEERTQLECHTIQNAEDEKKKQNEENKQEEQVYEDFISEILREERQMGSTCFEDSRKKSHEERSRMNEMSNGFNKQQQPQKLQMNSHKPDFQQILANPLFGHIYFPPGGLFPKGQTDETEDFIRTDKGLETNADDFMTPPSANPRMELPSTHSTIYETSREYIESSMSNQRQTDK